MLCYQIYSAMSDSQEEGFFKQQLSICFEDAICELFTQTTQKKIGQPEPLCSDEQKHITQVFNNPKFVDSTLRQQQLKDLYSLNKEKVIFCNLKGHKYPIKRNVFISFNSLYEAGNLDMVVQAKPDEYHLYLRPDTNTNKPCQWFNFKCKCSLINSPITFKICNMKQYSLYQQGFRPFTKTQNSEWSQIDSKLEFSETPNGICIMFCYKFSDNNEIVQFAGSPPYTVSDLNSFISEIQTSKKIKIKTIGVSSLRIPIQCIEIGDCKDFKSVVGLAISRQHPGETSGSYVIQEFIKQLIKTNQTNVMWIVVPMVNVDGVYLGNNRHNLAGYDLNRHFNIEQDVSSTIQKQKALPEVTGVLKLVKQMKSRFGKKFKIFLDFHGHSTMPCSFSYGPPIQKNDLTLNAMQVRLFPYLIADKTQHFKTELCSYNIKKYKQNAARSFLLKKYKVPFSYTIQTSYGLGDKNRKLLIKDFLDIGRSVAQASIEMAKYLIYKEYSFQKDSAQIQKCKLKIDKIKQELLKSNCQSEDGPEVDSSDDDQQKTYPRTLTDARLELKIHSKKSQVQKLIEHKKIGKTRQRNATNPDLKVPRILLKSQHFKNKIGSRTPQPGSFSKRLFLRPESSNMGKLQRAPGRQSCLQKKQILSLRIKKFCYPRTKSKKQCYKNQVDNGQKLKRKDGPLLVFY